MESPENTRTVEHPTTQVLKAAQSAVGVVRDEVTSHLDAHPYGTLAAAAGVGYLLAGGLFSGLTVRILGFALRTGLRLAVVPLVEVELVRAAQDWVASETPSHQGGTNGRS